MATTIMERPYGINWSKNLIRYVLQTDTPINTPGLYIEIRLQYQGAADPVFYTIYEQPAYPAPDGTVVFSANKILDSDLKYQLPDVDLITPQKLTGQAGKFFIHFREITAEDPDPDWIITEEAHELIVLKGGLSYERWQGPNYFVNYFAANYTYLTWQLSGRFCALDERMYLYFLLPRDAGVNPRMKVSVAYTDGTFNNTLQAAFPGAPKQYDVFALNVGATELNLPALDPAKKIWYYEISVEDDTGIMALPFRYYIDYRNTYNTTRFNYINSLGGMDSVRVLGEIESEIQRDHEIAAITPSAGYLNDNSLAPQEFIQAITLSQKYKGNLGFLQRKEMLYLTDLFASPQVVQFRFSRWQPVLVTSQTVPTPKRGEELPSLPVEWKYGFTNTQFTPDFVDIGNLPVCPIVINAQVTSQDISYTYISWTGDPLHTRYRVTYEHYFDLDGSDSGTIYTQVTSVQIRRPTKPSPGFAVITAICALGNESNPVTVQIPNDL